MDKYTEEERKCFTKHLNNVLKVCAKASIYKAMNINIKTFENRLITQNWKDHEIEYYKRTFNF
jgi:hypothetical protein